MHDMWLGFMSIIGRNVTDDWPGCSPSCIICMKPDHSGPGDRMGHVTLARKLSFKPWSGTLISCSSANDIYGFTDSLCLKYVISMLPADTSCSVETICLNTGWLLEQPGVTRRSYPFREMYYGHPIFEYCGLRYLLNTGWTDLNEIQQYRFLGRQLH